MNERVKRLAGEAALLTATERAELIDEIMQSLDAPEPANDAAWAREAADRLEAFRRGEIDSVGLDEALASRPPK